MFEQKNNHNEEQSQGIQQGKQQQKSSSLLDTFIPKQLISKTKVGLNTTTIQQKHTFDKVGGNIYLEISPPEIKFAGYELNKMHTATVKIINKAPIPQRIHLIPPTETNGAFSVKFNKKGAIPSGMSENVIVQFKSDMHKYQCDQIKINSETQNFVIPLYAYPTIPNIERIFPKIIDFGSVLVNQTDSNIYPIQNPVPSNFQYEFVYEKQCQEIMINPLKGIIQKQQTLNIQISFSPKSKKTYLAEVYLRIKQFDFQPLKIKIMGTGKDPKATKTNTETNFGRSAKRISSSKLAPLKKQGQGSLLLVATKGVFRQSQRIIQNQELRQVYSGQNPIEGRAIQQQQRQRQTNQKGTSKISKRPLSGKKNMIRSSFPKLLATKRPAGNTLINNQQSLLFSAKGTMNPKKLEQKQYLSRFNRVFDLDKQKDIKFSQFLGDKAMTEQELEFQNKLRQETHNARLEIIHQCIQRYDVQYLRNVDVDYEKLAKNQLTFDDNKNDELKARQMKLNRLMNAGTKVILKYRMLKRLDKIRQFLADCQGDKRKVAKKVEESYIKSLEVGFDNSKKSLFDFSFSLRNLQPQSFPIFYKQSEGSAKTQEITFQTQGKPQFDDLTTLPELERHETEAFTYVNSNVPPEFVNFVKQIPMQRRSAEQQYALRGPSLPQFMPIGPTSVYSLPLKVPNHFFIYDDLKIRRYKNYDPVDQKDVQYLYDQNLAINPIEDQFQGWTRGQYQVLKAKLMRNSGVQFTQGFQGYCGSGYANDLGFLGKIDKHLPFAIQPSEKTKNEDFLDEGDSDQEKDPTLTPKTGQQLAFEYESNDKKIKQRRDKPVIVNEERQMLIKIEGNIAKIKDDLRSNWVDKVSDLNKWAVQAQNRIYL